MNPLKVYQGQSLVVHYFTPADQTKQDMHGLVLAPERFRGAASVRPDSRLLMWHYRQCSQMHFRGFAWRMSVDEALDEIAP